MKQIEEYIESNIKLLEECKKEYDATKNEYERLRIKSNMIAYKHYIMGLKDAKKYIEEENNKESD